MQSGTAGDEHLVDQKVVLAGVGGQGVLFATRLLSETAQALGLPFVSSEIHGMSQRGGSVVSHFKIGPYESPLVRRGDADLLLAFALDEGYRNLGFLRSTGGWVVNGPHQKALDADIADHLAGRGVQLYVIDAEELVQESPRMANVVLVGFAAGCAALRLPAESLEATLATISPARFRALNQEAFRRGREAGETMHR